MSAKVEISTRNGELIATTQKMIQERLEEFAEAHRRLKEVHVSVDVGNPARPVVQITTAIGAQELVSEASADNVVQAVDDAIRHLRNKLEQRLQERKEHEPEDRDDSVIKLGGGVAVVLLAGILGFTILRTSGCGSADSIERFPLTGKITFKGNPVPAGEISFQPNKGNTGPGALAKLVDGVYKVELIAGSHELRIVGLDAPPIRGAGPAPGERAPKPLFPEYTTEVEIAKESSTKDFEVPAQ